MSCCGSKRAQVAGGSLAARTSPSLPQIPSLPATSEVRVRYMGERGLSLRGPASGRVYVFSALGVTRDVDSRDVEALLRMRWFERA